MLVPRMVLHLRKSALSRRRIVAGTRRSCACVFYIENESFHATYAMTDN